MTARRFHNLGLCVIPLKPRSKEADCAWKQFQTQRPTDEQIALWDQRHAPGNFGIVLGEVSGLIVIESDTPQAEAWCVANLDYTPMATKSARGLHRYFRPPAEVDPADIPATLTAGGLNIEIKRGGQYVVAPGSIHPSGHVYTEVEPWPENLDGVPELRLALIWDSLSGKATSRAESIPTTVSEGGRNTTLFREGSRLRRLGLDEAEIAKTLAVLNESRCTPPLTQAEVESIAHSCAKYEPAEDLFPTSETGDAEFLAKVYGDCVRFDHLTKGWLLYREHHWAEQTTGDVFRLALDAIRARQMAATKSVGDVRTKRLKWAADGEARRRQTNMLAIAQNILPIADAGDSWNTQTHLLGVRNGVVDLRSGLLRPGCPEDRITLVSPITFDPNVSTALWRQFILDICNGDAELAEYLQQVFGYILTGETSEQCFWIFYGEGSNGKSTLLETVTRHVLPNHSWSMTFPSAKWSESMSEYQKAQLVGRRVIVSKENEQTQNLNTEFIKSLTGDETIAARHPYGRPFNFTPVAKFVLAVNHKPKILDETHGMWRRVRLVPFQRTFEVNPAFAESLIAERQSVLTWAVEGAVRYYAAGRLATPKSVLAATAEYRQESDALAEFFTDCCAFGPTMRTKAKPLFDALQAWYERQQTPHVERISQKELGRRIAADNRFSVGPGKGSERFTVIYSGVALVERDLIERGMPDGAM